MAIITYSGTELVSVSNVKIHKNGGFEDVSQVNAYVNGQWKKVFPTAQSYTKTYAISDGEIYWATGGKETSYSSQLIVGSYNSSKSSCRRSLLFFPLSEIKADLEGAEITSVELYLKRLNTSHGEGSCYTCIKLHGYSSPPTRWDDGPDLGAADSGTPVFTRGQGKWVTLLASVGEGLRDGIVKGICLDADSNYALSRYGRFDRASAKLRITYTKEG